MLLVNSDSWPIIVDMLGKRSFMVVKSDYVQRGGHVMGKTWLVIDQKHSAHWGKDEELACHVWSRQGRHHLSVPNAPGSPGTHHTAMVIGLSIDFRCTASGWQLNCTVQKSYLAVSQMARRLILGAQHEQGPEPPQRIGKLFKWSVLVAYRFPAKKQSVDIYGVNPSPKD